MQLRSECGEILSGAQSVNLNCPDHKLKMYANFCFDCNKCVCETCTQEPPRVVKEPKEDNNNNSNFKKKDKDGGGEQYVNIGHKGHYMKSLDEVLAQALKTKQQLRDEINDQFERIDAAIEYFTGMEEQFLSQKHLYM